MIVLEEPSARRTRPVRLCDIPFEDRLRALIVARADAGSDDERLSLIAAAVCPSDTVYYIHEEAA